MILDKVKIAMICLTAICISAMFLGKDGVITQSVISFILILAGYEIAQEKKEKEDVGEAS